MSEVELTLKRIHKKVDKLKLRLQKLEANEQALRENLTSIMSHADKLKTDLPADKVKILNQQIADIKKCQAIVDTSKK